MSGYAGKKPPANPTYGAEVDDAVGVFRGTPGQPSFFFSSSLTWAGLAALFAQACVQRNMLQIITIAVGFMMQSGLMALIFFK
jgi:hypothetical protein